MAGFKLNTLETDVLKIAKDQGMNCVTKAEAIQCAKGDDTIYVTFYNGLSSNIMWIKNNDIPTKQDSYAPFTDQILLRFGFAGTEMVSDSLYSPVLTLVKAANIVKFPRFIKESNLVGQWKEDLGSESKNRRAKAGNIVLAHLRIDNKVILVLGDISASTSLFYKGDSFIYSETYNKDNETPAERAKRLKYEKEHCETC